MTTSTRIPASRFAGGLIGRRPPTHNVEEVQE
jgi:hypothetical protein